MPVLQMNYFPGVRMVPDLGLYLQAFELKLFYFLGLSSSDVCPYVYVMFVSPPKALKLTLGMYLGKKNSVLSPEDGVNKHYSSPKALLLKNLKVYYLL